MSKNVGDRVLILIGPHKNKSAEIIKVEYNKGAANGWFTVRLDDGTTLLYAGEEITL